MRGFLLIVLAGVMSASVSAADIRDLRDLSSGENATVFIGFDSVPELRSSRVDADMIELEFAGGEIADQRRIEAVGGSVISALEVLPADETQLIRIELPHAAEGFEFVPTETGYLLSWHIIGMPLSSPSATATDLPSDSAALSASVPVALDMEADYSSEEADEGSVAISEPVVLIGDTGCAAAQAAVEINSWDIDALAVHSECLLEQGDANQAIVLLERVIAFEPGRFDAVLTLAEAREAQGDIDAARDLYEQAASVAATDGQAVAARARARALTD